MCSAITTAVPLLLLLIGTVRAAAAPEPQNLGKSRLGRSVGINLGTQDLALSRAFYERLGFKVLQREGPLSPLSAQLHDGGVTLHLYRIREGRQPPLVPQLHSGDVALGLHRIDYQPSLSLTYTVNDLAETAAVLKAAGIDNARNHPLDVPFRFVDPNGLNISLFASKVGGPATIRVSTARCGKFGALAVRTKDLKASVAFWQALGFQQIKSGEQPHPFALLTDGLIMIGFHQTDEFEAPHLTYFSADVKRRIAVLKKDGFRFLDEIKDDRGEINGGTLVSPDGQRIFVLPE